MTDPLLPEPVPARSRVSIELIALLAVLLGAVLLVWGAWAYDWRAGLLVLGGLLVAGGTVVGSEGT